MGKKTGCYIYAYLRSTPSEYGEVGSPYYIGKGNHGRGFYARAFDKRHNVHIPSDTSNVVIFADDLTDNDARQAEMLLIFLHGRVDLNTGCLRNLTDGGEGNVGRVVTQETRNKISKGHKGKIGTPWTAERRVAMSARMSGKNNPSYAKSYPRRKSKKETENIQTAQSNTPSPSEGVVNQIRFQRTEETRKKKENGRPKTGWRHTEEAKMKMRAAKIGGHHTEEHKAKISASGKVRWAKERESKAGV